MFGIKLKHLIGFILILALDFAVYIVLGLLMMNYDDFYDESKGEYWSWESMNATDKLVFSSLQIWNIINIIAVGFLIYFIIKRVKNA